MFDTRHILAVSSAIILLMSIIGNSGLFTEAFAAITFKHFDGIDDFVDVASSTSLQLTKFSLEVRFKTSQTPTQWAFLANKGSSSGTTMNDVNYGMFIDTNGKVGAGYRAADGTLHFIYSSSALNNNAWIKAKVTYDGAKLKLYVDGVLDKTASTTKTVDTAGTEALRIGGSANSQTGFFKGDIDFIKIINLGTSSTAYFNDFESVTPTADDCGKLPAKSLTGVVFMDPILSKNEKGASFNAPSNYVTESLKYISLNGFKAIRVPYYWESYVFSSTDFMNEIDLIAKTAQNNKLCVIFDNHHFYATSYWNLQVAGKSDGRGFPSFVVKGFPAKNNDYIATAGPFWKAFLSNSYSIDGKKVWDVQADFFAKIIAKVDSYTSVAGYEILNEPHLFDESDYAKLGAYNTYMAKKIRALSDKKILFDRETTRGFERQPSKEPLIVPQGVTGLVYAPHLYSVPTPGSQGLKQVIRIDTWAKEWGVEVLMGEWGADTLTDTKTFLNDFKARGFGWTYHSWKPTVSGGLGSSLYQSSTVNPTAALVQLIAGYTAVY
jgi:cellulase (glycosyl hydrolase family 5)/concanavalin A-like lectin/glucanase superfamily protein